MRKKVLVFMALGLLIFSCSKDDEPESECRSCIALGEILEICPSKSESAEKTYQVWSGGEVVQTITQSNLDQLGGITPKQYVQNLCDYANENQ